MCRSPARRQCRPSTPRRRLRTPSSHPCLRRAGKRILIVSLARRACRADDLSITGASDFMVSIATLRNSCGSLRLLPASLAPRLQTSSSDRSHPNSLTIWDRFAIEVRLSGKSEEVIFRPRIRRAASGFGRCSPRSGERSTDTARFRAPSGPWKTRDTAPRSFPR